MNNSVNPGLNLLRSSDKRVKHVTKKEVFSDLAYIRKAITFNHYRAKIDVCVASSCISFKWRRRPRHYLEYDTASLVKDFIEKLRNEDIYGCLIIIDDDVKYYCHSKYLENILCFDKDKKWRPWNSAARCLEELYVSNDVFVVNDDHVLDEVYNNIDDLVTKYNIVHYSDDDVHTIFFVKPGKFIDFFMKKGISSELSSIVNGIASIVSSEILQRIIDATGVYVDEPVYSISLKHPVNLSKVPRVHEEELAGYKARSIHRLVLDPLSNDPGIERILYELDPGTKIRFTAFIAPLLSSLVLDPYHGVSLKAKSIVFEVA